MSNKEGRNKVNLFVLVAVIQMIIVLVIISYMSFLLVTKSRELNAKTQQLQQLVQTSNTVEALKKNIEEGNKEINSLKGYFFTDDTLLAFLKNFCDAARSKGMDITNITFQELSTKIETTPPVKALPVQINLSGSYNSTIQFLKYLEQNKEKIEEIELNYMSGTLSLNLVFYVQTNSSPRWVYERSVP